MSVMKEAETCFLQACHEHNCQEIELQRPFLLGCPAPFINYRILVVEQYGGVLEAAGRAAIDAPYTLQIVMHCATLFLKEPPSAVTLQRLFALNGRERDTAFLVDSVKPHKLLLTTFVSDLDEVPQAGNQRELIWKSVRHLFEVWKLHYAELRDIVSSQEREPKPAPPPPKVSQASGQWSAKSLLLPIATTRQRITEILKKYLDEKGFKNLKYARREPFEITYFAVVNNGATLSKPSRTFPEVFFFSERMMVVQIIYSRNETPFSVPTDCLPAFQQLVLHINNRLRLGRFQISKLEKQISYQYFLPFYTLTEGEVKSILPKTIDFCIDRFKLYSMAFSKLLHHLEGGKPLGDTYSYVRSCEEIKPDYKDLHSATNFHKLPCKAAIKCKDLSRDVAKFEFLKGLYEELKSILRDSLLDCLTFDEVRKTVRYRLENAKPILKFVEEFGHAFAMSDEVMRICRKLEELGVQLPEPYENAFFVTQGENGSFKCRLLPWNFAKIDGSSSSASSELITKLLRYSDKDSSGASSTHDLSFFIPEAELEQENRIYKYKGEEVKLWLLPGQENHLKSMTKHLVAKPCSSNMPFFSHLYGFVDMALDKRRYRVQKRLDALYKRKFPSMDSFKVCDMLQAVGKALRSLHQFEWMHYCLTPRFLALENRAVYFKNCAFLEKTVRDIKFKKQDLWFLPPEELTLLSCDSAEARTALKRCGASSDVYSYSRMLYFYFVDSGQHDNVNDPVPSFQMKPKDIEAGDIDAVLQRYEEGRRPLIPESFEDKYPKLTIRMRQSWESPPLRPPLDELIGALETEGDFDLCEEDQPSQILDA